MNRLPASHAVTGSKSRSVLPASDAVTGSTSRSPYQQLTQWYWQQVTQLGLRELPLYVVLQEDLNLSGSFLQEVSCTKLTTKTRTSCAAGAARLDSGEVIVYFNTEEGDTHES